MIKMVLSCSKNHMGMARYLAERYGWRIKIEQGCILLIDSPKVDEVV